MPSTYTPITSTTLSSDQSSITFSSIPQIYTDLVLVCSGSTTSTGASIWLRVNGVTTGYSWTRLYGSGSSVGTDRASNQGDIPVSTGNFTNSTSIIHFSNYATTTTNKQILARINTTTYAGANIAATNSNSAISSINIRVQSLAIATGSTFTLYGIKAA